VAVCRRRHTLRRRPTHASRQPCPVDNTHSISAERTCGSASTSRLVVTERALEKHVTSILQKLRLLEAPDTHGRVLAVLAHLRS
jgi:hypothetical protein